MEPLAWAPEAGATVVVVAGTSCVGDKVVGAKVIPSGPMTVPTDARETALASEAVYFLVFSRKAVCC